MLAALFMFRSLCSALYQQRNTDSAPHSALALLSMALLALIFLSACQTPTGKLRETAKSQGFERTSIRSGGFEHTVFDSVETERIKTLHVYLEGDGSPWRYRTVVMPDPTPRQPLMLWLMGLDPAPSVYVGRPCYNGTFEASGCESHLWTSGRYSKTVVKSMAGVLRTLVKRYSVSELWLLGHSGGAHHRYTPLFTSLNPALREPLPASIRQWHLMGGRDGVIPPNLVQSFMKRQLAPVARIVDEYGHGCCWSSIWPKILQAIEADAPGDLPGHAFRPVAPQAAVRDSP